LEEIYLIETGVLALFSTVAKPVLGRLLFTSGQSVAGGCLALATKPSKAVVLHLFNIVTPEYNLMDFNYHLFKK